MKRVVLIIFLALSCLAASAQSVPSLLIPSDASSPLASTVLFADGHAYESNTAAVVFAGHPYSAWGSYLNWAPDAVATTSFGGGLSASIGKKLALGLSYRTSRDQSYDVVNSSGLVSGTFTPKDMILTLGVSYKISPSVGAGVKLCRVSSAIGKEAEGSAYCADVTAFYRKDAIDISAGFFNLGSKISWGGESYPLPAIVKCGAAYRVAAFRAGVEAEYLLSGVFGASAGVEYSYSGFITARAGYHLGGKNGGLPSYASFGLGAAFAGVSLNAAYLFASPTLGGSWTVGLGYSF